MWLFKTAKFMVAFVAVLLIAGMVTAAFYETSTPKRVMLEEQRDHISAVNAGLNREKNEMEREVKAINNSQGAIERIVRQDLGYVKTDEIMMILPK